MHGTRCIVVRGSEGQGPTLVELLSFAETCSEADREIVKMESVLYAAARFKGTRKAACLVRRHRASLCRGVCGVTGRWEFGLCQARYYTQKSELSPRLHTHKLFCNHFGWGI